MLWGNFLYNLLTKSEKNLCPQTSTEKLVVWSYKQSRCLIKTFVFFRRRYNQRSEKHARILLRALSLLRDHWNEDPICCKCVAGDTEIQKAFPQIDPLLSNPKPSSSRLWPIGIPPGISSWGNSNRKFYHKHYPSVLNIDPILWKCVVIKIIEYPSKFIFLSRSQVKMNAQP